MEGEMKGIVLEGLLVVLCIDICGCNMLPDIEYCKNSRSYPYWTEWEDGKLVSIVNDSLAAVKTRKYKKECREDDTEVIVGFRAGLYLVNYRTKQKPLRGDTLELPYDLEIPSGALIDSSALVFDFLNKKFGFWKIGEKSIKFSGYNDISGSMEYIRDINPWVNKEIAIRSYNHSQSYLHILDTEKGQIKIFDPEEYEWIFSSEDKIGGFLSYVDGKVIYIREDNKHFELIVDGIVTDTSLPFYIYKCFGNYIAPHNVSIANAGILKIDTENFKFDETLELWVDRDDYPAKFYKNRKGDDSVSYSGKDLTGSK